MSVILRFDGAALPPGERFGRYRDLYADGTDAVELGPAFRADVRGWKLDGTVIFERRLHDVGHVRAAGRAGRDGFSHHVLTLVVAGRVEVDAGDGYVLVPPGAGLLADAGRPARNRLGDAHLFTVRLDRVRAAGTAHGLLLTGEAVGLLTDHVAALTRRAERLDPVAVSQGIKALHALVAGALGAGANPAGRTVGAEDRLERVRAIVDARLASPGLLPNDVVGATGLSRATVYRLLAPHGGLSAYIRERRLERLAIMLHDRAERRSFAELAAAVGLTAEAHARRLFRKRYGVSPGLYRGRWTVGPDPALPKRAMRLLDAAYAGDAARDEVAR